MAHIDLYRRYGHIYYGNTVEELHQNYIGPIFNYMADKQIALEINTSGLRRGINDLHPSETIIKAAVNAGISRYTTGSDAHSINELGQGLDRADQVLSKYALSIATYTKRQPDQHHIQD